MLKVTMKQNLKPLENLARNAKELYGQHSVSLPDLLTPGFLQRCSRFESADDLFEASGFNVESPEDFVAIPDSEWDNFISANTSFHTWKAMLDEAVKEWTVQRLGL